MSFFNLAQKIGRPVDEIPRVHPYWIRAAVTLLEAEQIKRDADEAKAKQGQ